MKTIDAVKQGLVRTKEYADTTFCNALKGTATGAVVNIDDASPLEHKMNIKVSGVDNPNAIKVFKQGKNFLRFDDGSYTMSRYSAGVNRTATVNVANSHISIILEPNSFFVQADWVSSIGTHSSFYLPKGTYKFGALNVVKVDGTSCSLSIVDAESEDVIKSVNCISNDNVSDVFTISESKEVYLYCYLDNTNSTEQTIEADFVLYNSTVEMTFEPYVATEYTPNADGTVEGITPLYPITVFFTEGDVATIECEYNKEVNSAFKRLEDMVASLNDTLEVIENGTY